MATKIPVALSSASDYQNEFNLVARDTWSGSCNLIPVSLVDGRNVWISGLSWAGGYTSGVRTAAAPTIMNNILLQGNKNIIPYNRMFSDSGYSHYFDSRQITGTSDIARVDPVSAISVDNSLLLSATVSSDFTSSVPSASKIYLVQYPLDSLSESAVTALQAVALPTYGNLVFGSSLLTFDDRFIFILGRKPVSSTFSHYLARVDRNVLLNLRKIKDNIQYFSNDSIIGWTKDITQASAILSGVGRTFELYKSSKNTFNYLWSSGMVISKHAQKTIHRLGADIRPASIDPVMTVTPDAGSSDFVVRGVRRVPWVKSTPTGNEIGFYLSTQSSLTFDRNYPLFSRPHFFEYSAPSMARI